MEGDLRLEAPLDAILPIDLPMFERVFQVVVQLKPLCKTTFFGRLKSRMLKALGQTRASPARRGRDCRKAIVTWLTRKSVEIASVFQVRPI